MCRCKQITESSSSPNPNREVLPTNVSPLHYELTLEPNFDSFKFDGSVDITVQINERTNFIELNSIEIEIHSAFVNDVKVSKITYNEEEQTARFELDDHLIEGAEAILRLTFTGILNDKMAGFYRSTYQEDGKTKYLATTQMEPTDCRRAFPSFDEPALKATFLVSLISHRDLVCLSNMNEKRTELIDGTDKKKVRFHKTPLMSTYLVAFIVGDLKSIETNKFRVPIKVYATPGSEHLGQYSLDIAVETLKFFEEKFDIPYPLPKCDMVAIHDFSAGAMENFGLITFRTIDLLIDQKKANVNIKQRVTEVVMHELAHQWFGNLVTMDFWDGLWLNEGFATWMSWYACDSLYPDWKVWELYVSDSLQSALGLDSLRSSHPIEVPVKRADEINQIFDAISYSKGSSLLKMISNWLGQEVFIKGVSNYLKKHMWGNTTTPDLWASLAEVSGKDVIKVMDIWTKNVGYPVVKVEENATTKEITLTQNRYLKTGDVTAEEDKVLYPVFLGLKTSKGIDELVVLDKRTSTLKLSDADFEFYKVNGNSTGVYRTAYEPARWVKLGQAAVDGKLSVEDRVGLVADAGALTASGNVSTTDFLSLVRSWSSESNYVVWDELTSRIGALKGAFRFEDEEVNDCLNNFTADLLREKLLSTGWDFKPTDTFAEEQLKTALFAASLASKQKDVAAFADAAFKDFIAGNKAAIHPNLRGAIFGHVAKGGDLDTWDAFYNIYKEPSSDEEKIAALRALGSFTKPELLKKLTDRLLQSDFVKPQDIHVPLQGMRRSRIGTETLWSWFKENWDEIYKLLPPGLSTLGSVVSLSTSGFTKREQREDIVNFFKGKETKGFNQSLATSLDSITTSINVSERDSKKVLEWLTSKGYSTKGRL